MKTKGLTGQQLEETLKKNFDESRFDPTKKRYGLFSFPGTLAVSEDSLGKHILHPRDTDGKVLTAPKNFYTHRGKSGKINDAYFEPPKFATVNDPFKDNLAISHTLNKERAKKMIETHEVAFKPGGPVKEKVAIYPHESDYVERKKNFRDPESHEVKVGPKNFMTNPPKKGEANSTPGVLLGGDLPHEPDPYGRKDQMARDERLRNQAKMPQAPFKNMSHGAREFADVTTTYGLDVEIKPKKPQVKAKAYSHDHPFVPSNPAKTGLTDKTLAPFPEYMSGQSKDKVRNRSANEHAWKHTYNGLTKPSPSVLVMPRNLRSVSIRSTR
jgi:hypothetical protein